MNLKSTAANGFNCLIINSVMASWEVCLTWLDCTVYVSWFDYSWAVNTSNLGSVGSSLRQETSSCLAFLHPGIWMGTTDIFWGPGATQEWTTILHKIDGKLRTSLPPKSRKGKWQILASAQLTICFFSMLIAWGAVLIVWLQLSGTSSSKFPSTCIGTYQLDHSLP